MAAFALARCTKPKPVTLVGQDFYLVSTDIPKSKYKQINYQFKEKDVQVFAITNFHPMQGDVSMGAYSFIGNNLKLPLIGSFKIKQTAEGFDLYAYGKLKYKLSKNTKPFIQQGATALQRQFQFASITNWR